MNFRHLLTVLLVFTASFISAQLVTIKDHNGSTTPVITCDYNFVTCTDNPANKTCISLTAEYPDIKPTVDYTVSSINYTPVGNFNEGSEIIIEDDDTWSKVISFPTDFKFCLYGKSFDSMILTDNGVISFDKPQENTGKKAPYSVAGTVTSGKLSAYTIFGAYHDLTNDKDSFGCKNMGTCGKILVNTTGTAPFRKIIVNYYQMNHFNCNSNINSTFQIVLYETTNIIEVYIKQKPSTCDKIGSVNNSDKDISLIGITNQLGMGIAPPGRNAESWTVTNGEAWRFTPEGTGEPTITWYDTKTKAVLGNGKTLITPIPTENSVYQAEVTYNVCGLQSLYGTIPINFVYEYPTATPVEKNECYKGKFYPPVNFDALIPEAIAKSIAGVKTSLHESEDDARVGTPITSSTSFYPMTSNEKTLYLRVEHPNNPQCFSIVPLTIFLRITPEYEDKIEIEYCEEEGDKTILDLNKIDILGLPNELKAYYYPTEKDAINKTNAISRIEMIPPSTRIIYARIFNTYFSECAEQIVEVTLKSKNKIELADKIYVECGTFFIPDFDLTQYEIDYPDYYGKYDFYYYKTRADAMENKEETRIKYPQSYPVDDKTTIYVRINFPDEKYCFPIFRIVFTTSNPLMLPSINHCDDGSGKININLVEYFYKNAPQSAKILGFYEDSGLTHPISNTTNFEIDRNTIIYVSYEKDKCQHKSPINISFYKMYIVKEYIVCNTEKDGLDKEEVNLANLNNFFLSNYTYGSTISYYVSQSDADKEVNPIKTPVVITKAAPVTIYVRIKTPFGCIFIHPTQLKLEDYFFAETNDLTVRICDNNNDNKEIVNLTLYNSSLITLANPVEDIKKYKFTYYTSYDKAISGQNPDISNPQNYTLQNFNTPIYVKISDESTCFSVVKLKFDNINQIFATDHPTIYVCNPSGTGSETIDLLALDPISTMINNASVSDLNITYHDTEDKANTSTVSTTTKDLNNLIINSGTTNIWVRFENKTPSPEGLLCYTVRNIKIEITYPPKAKNDILVVCDEDFDGVYTVDLNTLNSLVISPPEDYIFSYYWKEDLSEIAQTNNGSLIITDFHVGAEIEKKIYIKVTDGRVINKDLCFNISEITLTKLEEFPVTNTAVTNETCDDDFDGITTFNLASDVIKLHDPAIANVQYKVYHTYEDAKNDTNAQNLNRFVNRTPHNDQAYIRISSPQHCPSIGVISLTVLPVPVSPLQAELKICRDETLDLNAYTGNDEDTYLWSTGETTPIITIEKEGNYWVTITGANGCSYTYHTNVSEYPLVTITKLIAGNNYITVIAEGPEPLEYSIDNVHWQNSNNFVNLSPDTYTFYVRSKSTPCKPAVDKGIIFEIPNAITPNGDGYNDVWTLCGLDLFKGETSHIQIFDRYGKVVFEETSKTCFNWNGYYLGRPLPTTSYWYIIKIADGREFTGWIMLKNYNQDNL